MNELLSSVNLIDFIYELTFSITLIIAQYVFLNITQFSLIMNQKNEDLIIFKIKYSFAYFSDFMIA